MLGMNWQRKLPKQLFMLLLVVFLGWSIASCSKPPEGTGLATIPRAARSKLVEVSPPFVIQNLKSLSDEQPQVKILSPRPDQIIDQTEVSVKLQVSDFSLYKDEELELGSYLQVLLDNQPYAQVYDTEEPLTVANLKPGTHTLRVFAVRPWHESFKNDGAFAQTSFHVFAKTGENQPDSAQPLLTYNAPQDTVGTEPILLDFYLTNAPLHLVAREDAEDEIPDWQIRCTINGESFTFDRWEPIYLKGFKPGRNWVQLELLDDKGNPLLNAFNNVVQLITYEPGGNDALSRMIRGELTAEAARKIVDPNYVPPAPEPEPEPEPEVILEPDVLEPDLTQEPAPESMPPEMIAPTDEDALETLPELTAEPEPSVPVAPEAVPEILPESEPAELDLNLDEDVEPVAPALIAPTASPTEATSESSPFQIIIAPEGNAAPVEVKPVPQPAAPSVPELLPKQRPATASDPSEAVKTRLEEIFQPTAPEQLEPIPLPEQLETSEPTQPLQIEFAPAAPPLNSLLDSLQPEPVTLPAADEMAPEFSLQPPKIPSMVNALDRVKGFFENLRKRPNEPTLLPLLEYVPDVPSNSVQ